MKKIMTLILCLAIVLSLAACSNTSTGNTPDTGINVDGDDIFIRAAGLEMKYPAVWKDKVDVQVSDDEVVFTSGDVKLFSILFNSSKGDFLGVVHGKTDTAVSVLVYDTHADDSEIQEMREDVNVILDHLKTDYDFETGEQAAVFDIETPIVTLKYPLKWKDRVTIDVSAEKVSFSDNGTALFDLVFSECDGDLLGTYNGTPIYVVGYAVEMQDQLDMQEDLNVILDYLQEENSFVLSDG